MGGRHAEGGERFREHEVVRAMQYANQTPDYITDIARELRQNMTPAEKLLWERLRKRQLQGNRFRKQHPVYRYILDFYCAEKMLAVEIDGHVHNDTEEYDEYRKVNIILKKIILRLNI